MPARSPLSDDDDQRTHSRFIEAIHNFAVHVVAAEFGLPDSDVDAILQRFNDTAQRLHHQAMAAQNVAAMREVESAWDLWKTTHPEDKPMNKPNSAAGPSPVVSVCIEHGGHPSEKCDCDKYEPHNPPEDRAMEDGERAIFRKGRDESRQRRKDTPMTKDEQDPDYDEDSEESIAGVVPGSTRIPQPRPKTDDDSEEL